MTITCSSWRLLSCSVVVPRAKRRPKSRSVVPHRSRNATCRACGVSKGCRKAFCRVKRLPRIELSPRTRRDPSYPREVVSSCRQSPVFAFFAHTTRTQSQLASLTRLRNSLVIFLLGNCWWQSLLVTTSTVSEPVASRAYLGRVTLMACRYCCPEINQAPQRTLIA